MNQVRTYLERERSRAIDRLRKVDVRVGSDEDASTALRAMTGRDEADEVQANEHREMGLVSRARLVDRINRLTVALNRLADGTYGLCVECGDPIEAPRLRAIPEVATCLRCQAELERTGGRPRGTEAA